MRVDRRSGARERGLERSSTSSCAQEEQKVPGDGTDGVGEGVARDHTSWNLQARRAPVYPHVMLLAGE